MAASIRSRIVFTLVSALIVAGLVASWATYHSTRSELSGLFDEQLRHTALELIERGDNDIIGFLSVSLRRCAFWS